MKKILILIFAGLISLSAQSQSKDYTFCSCKENLSSEGKYTLTCRDIVMEEGQYENGKRTGPWISRNTDGEIVIKANYVNDELDGAYQQFHFKGDKKLEAQFKQGVPDGHWKYYNDKGRIIKAGSFANGTPTGLWKIYNKKGKKTVVEYDFTSGKAIKFSDDRYFNKGGIARDDISGEWMVLFFPQRNINADYKPLGGYLLAGDIFLDYLNLPYMYMNTYAHHEFLATVLVKNGKAEIQKIEERNREKRFDPSKASFPFIVQTNSPGKLTRVEHSDVSLKLLKGRIKDVLALSGPWIGTETEGIVAIQIPFVVNDIKK